MTANGWPSMAKAAQNDPPAVAEPVSRPLAPLPLAGSIAAQAPPTRDDQGRFLTGNIGGGRKKGSRNRLTDTFIAAVENDFAEHGPDALARLRTDDPASYIRIVASLVPRDLVLKREQEQDYSDHSIAEVEAIIDHARKNGMIEKLIERANRGY